jgi:hypothetical protein
MRTAEQLLAEHDHEGGSIYLQLARACSELNARRGQPLTDAQKQRMEQLERSFAHLRSSRTRP